MTGMMIDEPDRVGSKPHPENFRQTLASAPLLVELKHWCLAKRSFLVSTRTCLFARTPRVSLPIAIRVVDVARQRYDIHLGWAQSGAG